MELVSEKYHRTHFDIPSIYEKIRVLPGDLERALRCESILIPSVMPERDAPLFRGFQGAKKGLSSKEGQARLLHELANIELQAMELAFRTLVEFPEAPREFREQLAELTLSESRHLNLCLEELERLGFHWGHWPVHLHLWKAVSAKDSLLDRLVIVHRYLEASGLDAGALILKRLETSHAPGAEKAVRVISEEEIGHVAFGSRWYQQICRDENLDPDQDFRSRLQRLKSQLPKRVTAIDPNLRRQAGFTEAETAASQELLREFTGNLRPYVKVLK